MSQNKVQTYQTELFLPTIGGGHIDPLLLWRIIFLSSLKFSIWHAALHDLFLHFHCELYLCRTTIEGNGNPLHCSCLENPRDGGAWWAIYGVTYSRTQLKWLSSSSNHTFRASLVAQLVKNLPAMQETWIRSLGWEDPLEKGRATHSSILVWRIPWTKGVVKSRTWLSNFHFHHTFRTSQVVLVVKNLPVMQETWDTGSVPGLGRSPRGRHGNPLQYSCLEVPMDRGAS